MKLLRHWTWPNSCGQPFTCWWEEMWKELSKLPFFNWFTIFSKECKCQTLLETCVQVVLKASYTSSLTMSTQYKGQLYSVQYKGQLYSVFFTLKKLHLFVWLVALISLLSYQNESWQQQLLFSKSSRTKMSYLSFCNMRNLGSKTVRRKCQGVCHLTKFLIGLRVTLPRTSNNIWKN